MDIKIRLMRLGKRQVHLLDELRKRGFPKLCPSHLSNYLNGRELGPQRDTVLELSERILTEWESER